MFKTVLIFAIFAAASAHMAHYRDECKTELDIPQESIDKFSKLLISDSQNLLI